MESSDQTTGEQTDRTVDPSRDDDAVASLADIEEHSQFVEDYMRRLLTAHTPSTDEYRAGAPSRSLSSASVDHSPSSSETWRSNLNRDATKDRDAAETPESSELEEDDNRQRRPPADPRQQRELLSRMRRVANESVNSTLAEYDSMIGRTTLLKAAAAMLLLTFSFGLFALAASGQASLFFLGAGCWLTALYLSLPLFRHLRP